MGGRRPSSSDDVEKPVRKGPWSTLEDEKLSDYVTRHGHGNWKALPGLAELNRCGKSCRLRWMNYLRPEIKRGKFSPEEESLIVHLHSQVGNRWSTIAANLPGRTDNEIKNFWNTRLKKKLLRTGIDPETHMPLPRVDPHEHLLAQLLITTPTNYNWEFVATELAKLQMLNTLMETIRSLTSTPFLVALDSSLRLGPNYPSVAPAAVELPEYPPGANPTNSSAYRNNTLQESSPESSPDINSMFEDLDKLMEEDMTFLKEIFD